MAGRNVEFVSTIPGRCALSVNDANMPTPKGWAWTPLSDIARLESGHTPSRNHPEYWDGEIHWIGIRDAREHHGGRIFETSQRVTQAGIDNSAARVLPANTVCLSRTASVGYVVIMGRPMATSQDFVNWVCAPELDPEFLKWILLAEGQDGLRKFGKGSTHTTIYFPEVRAFHACIAPLNEQRRIVAKLDAIFEQTRAVKARLERLPALLDKLKRAILAAAFRGDLTADWRAANPDVAPASALLDRIRAERRGRWEAAMRAKGRDPVRSTYQPAQAADPSGLPALPPTWTWASVEELAVSHDSRRIPVKVDQRRERGGPYPYYGAFGIIDYVNEYIFDAELVLLAEDGKNLLTRDRPISLVASGRYWVNNHAHVLEVCAGCLPAYLSQYFNSADLRQRLTGIDQIKLTKAAMEGIPVPLPPSEEANALMTRMQQMLAQVDRKISATIASSDRIDRLERAALASAFRGALVTQDPMDEPAAVLLDRIRSVRAAETQRSRRRRSASGGEDSPSILNATPPPDVYPIASASDESLDLVVAAFQAAPRLTAPAITEATNLDPTLVKKALKTLVESGQVRVHGKARGTTYEWTP